MTPLPAGKALDAFFLEARSKILDLAAILDRIERGKDAAGIASRSALAPNRRGGGAVALAGRRPGRACAADFLARLRSGLEKADAALTISVFTLLARSRWI